MKDHAPTYAEVLEAARRAAQEIERDWPAWKRALSYPELDAGERDLRGRGAGTTEPRSR